MKTVPLRHVAEIRSSSVDKLSQDGELPVRLCNYTDVYYGDRLVPHSRLMRATATVDEVSRFRLDVGDSVITKDSEGPGDIGQSAYVSETAPDFVCAYHLAIVRPLSIEPRFLTWVLRSGPVRSHWSNQASGMTRYGLSLNGIRTAPTPLIGRDEQRRIADFLDDRVARIDQIIAARRQQLTLLAQAHSSANEQVARHSGPPVPLGRICSVVDARSESGAGELLSVSIHQGVLPRSEMTERMSRAEDLVGYKVVEPGDVVLNRMRAFQGAVGTSSFRGLVSPDYLVLRARSDISGAWLGILLRAPWLVGEMSRLLRGIGNSELGTVRTPRINWSDLATIVLNVPSIEEQEAMVRSFAAATELVRQLETRLAQAIDLLTEYKSSLITAAVTGELDVTTASRRILGD